MGATWTCLICGGDVLGSECKSCAANPLSLIAALEARLREAEDRLTDVRRRLERDLKFTREGQARKAKDVDQLSDRAMEAEARAEKSEARVAELEGVLGQATLLAQHMPGCLWQERNHADECDCGYAEFRAALAPSPPL